MAEPSQFVFSYKELAEMMVRQTGVKDGLWGVFVKFGIAASNIGETEESVRPAAIVPILEIGLQKFEKASNLTVDAALVSSTEKARTAR
jgi:hypothetical protein